MTENENDPLVDEVREIRARLNKEANYDLCTLASKAAEFAREAGFKFVRLPIARVAPAMA